MLKKGMLIEDKKTWEQFIITGFSKTHVYFTGYQKRGGIPKEVFHDSFTILAEG